MRISSPLSIGGLLCGIAWGVSGCGAVEDVRQWVESRWAEPASPPESMTPVSPPRSAPEEPRGGEGSTGAAPSGASSSTGFVASTTIPMSVDRSIPEEPPRRGSSTGGSTGVDFETGPGRGSSTGGSPGLSRSTLACLEGSWAVTDLSAYYRRVIRAQAHGRTVRHKGTRGRYSLSFAAGELLGNARHLRMRYQARLAEQDIDYTVDVHGTFTAAVREDGRDRLVILPPVKRTVRVVEIVRFPGGKTEERRPSLPLHGVYAVRCDPTLAELRPITNGKIGAAIRLERTPP